MLVPTIGSRWQILPFLALFIGIGVVNVACTETTPSKSKSGKFSKSEYEKDKNLLVGGKLYGEWWEVAKLEPPTVPPELWQKRASQQKAQQLLPRSEHAINGSEAWACSSCHGWNYDGTNYFQGISSLVGLENAENPALIYEYIRNGVSATVDNTPHRFGQLSKSELGSETTEGAINNEAMLPKQQIYNLTAFIAEIATLGIDVSGGDPNAGADIYANFNGTGCEAGNCHNTGSNTGIGPDELRTIALEEPEKLVHFVRFGGPIMPGNETEDTIVDPTASTALADAKNVLAFLAGGGTETPDPSQSGFDVARYNNTAKRIPDFQQGGLMYDKWWEAVVSTSAPQDTHPLWPNTNPKSGETTWRCKSCHGWDYRGADGVYRDGSNATGIRGILATNRFPIKYGTPDAVFTFLKQNAPHGFANRFSDDDYYGLTRFVMEVRAEDAQSLSAFDFVDDKGALISGKYNVDNGKILFSPSPGRNFCAGCHGADGQTMDFADNNPAVEPNVFVDTIAKENPWEFVHKVRFGDINGTERMPGLLEKPATYNTFQNAIDILAYSQLLLVPSDTRRAGRLYDNWLKEKSIANTPTTNHSLWPPSNTTKSGAETWRCKSCHGWDYKGANGMPALLRDLPSPRLQNAVQTAQFIKNGDSTANGQKHIFGSYLTDDDVNTLAEFITKPRTEIGIHDFQGINGNKDIGSTLYKGASPGGCEACHGTDGTKVPNVDLGVLANADEPEVLHKVRFGSPASSMLPSSTGFRGLSPQEAKHVATYAKTLAGGPTAGGYDAASVVRGGRLFDKWWTEMQISDASVQEPTVRNPKWAARDASIPDIAPTSPASETWRCKTCHSWKYGGIGFLRNSRADDLNYKRDLILSNPTMSLEQKRQATFNWIKSGANNISHNFGTAAELVSKLTDREIWDLTRFFYEGIINTDLYIFPTEKIARFPDIVKGTALYTGTVAPTVNCASCHGPDGRGLLDKGTVGVDILLLSAEDPWEFLHKVRVGQPGTAMPALIDPAISLSDDDARDVLGYAQDALKKRP